MRRVIPEEELARATSIRRERDLALTMSERLARLNELCKQASQLRDGTVSKT